MNKFHYLVERYEVLRNVARSAPLTLHDRSVSIFPDYTATVAKKRATFAEAKRLLRNCENVKFGIQFPAVLHITDGAGQEKRFEDPATAVEYIKKNLKPEDKLTSPVGRWGLNVDNKWRGSQEILTSYFSRMLSAWCLKPIT